MAPTEMQLTPKKTPNPKAKVTPSVQRNRKTIAPKSNTVNSKVTKAKDSENKQRTRMHSPHPARTVTKISTPKTSEKKTAVQTGSVKKPLWKRRPKPAHCGVPVPEKLRKILELNLIE